jgi:hypothetical protein
LEFAGDTLALYDADYSSRTNRLREVRRPRLFETVHRQTSAQQRLFELIVLGESGWLKAASPPAEAIRLHGSRLAADTAEFLAEQIAR